MSNRLNVFVLIDALGWTYLQEHKFLSDLLPYRQPLQTVLGFSSGAIPTMLTGVFPAQHGHWNLFYYNPAGSPFRWIKPFRVLPKGLLDNRYTRKLIKELGRRVLGMGPLFECCVSPSLLPWFDWVEKKNIYDSNGIVGTRSIFDRLGEQKIPYRVYSYHDGHDADLLQQATRDLRRGDLRFSFVYLSEIDSFLHHHCNSPEEIEKRLRWYEDQIRRLFIAAHEVDEDASLTVVSDHGMAPVRNTYDLPGDVEKIGLHMPDDYLAVYDSTMARFWFFNSSAKERVTDALRRVSCGHVLSEEELIKFGLTFSDNRYGEVIFLLDSGWMISRSDFHNQSWMPSGMHGYAPDDKYSDAIFLTNRKPHRSLSTIADLYGWMEDLNGVGTHDCASRNAMQTATRDALPG